jgi:hypothetical protein
VYGNPAYIDAGPWSRDEWAAKVKAENTGDANTVGQRARLAGAPPAGTQHEAAHRAVAVRVRFGGRRNGAVVRRGGGVGVRHGRQAAQAARECQPAVACW